MPKNSKEIDPFENLRQQRKQMTQEIIAAIKFHFGKRVQDLETNDTIIIHRLDQAGIPGI